MPDNINYYIPFVAKGDDDARTVSGYVSSPSVDCDEQIVDQDWLKGELPTWMASWGNIREMHQAKAVGKAQTVDLTTTPGPYLTTKIIDDDAWKKVKAGVYNGFSVGIKSPRIIFDGTAKNGRINGGTLVEVSIVDRPANDAAKFVLVKRAGANEWKLGDAGPVVEDLQKAAQSSQDATTTPKAAIPAALVCQPCGCGPDGAVDGCTCDCAICSAAKAANADATKRKFDTAERKDLADSGAARPDGSYPIKTATDVSNAVKDFGRSKGSAADKAHIVARAKAIGATDQLPADWPGSTQGKEKSMEPETGLVAADATAADDSVEKAAASHVEHKHPFKGTHNHAHAANSFGGSAMHTHAHLHNDDDMHDHPHLNGTDARLLSPEDRESAMNLQRAGGAYMAADADTSVAVADTTKAAADFMTAASSDAIGRPAAQPATMRGGTLAGLLRDAAARIEALVSDTDKDKDGDVDTTANMAAGGTGTPGTPAADFVAATAGDPKPDNAEPMSLSLSLTPEITKHLEALVSARVAAELSQRDFLTKAATSDRLDSIPDVIKLAGVTARALEAMALKAEAATQEATVTKAALTEMQADLARVKELAQPIKGQTFAYDKGLGLEPDRIYVDGNVPADVQAKKAAAAAVAKMSEQERVELSAMMLKQMYG